MTQNKPPVSPIGRAFEAVERATSQVGGRVETAALEVALAQAFALTRLAEAAERYSAAVEREANMTMSLGEAIDHAAVDGYTPPLWQPHHSPAEPPGRSM